jgi:hypothetical protein
MALMLDFTGNHSVFGDTTGIGFGVAENFSKHARTCPDSRKQEKPTLRHLGQLSSLTGGMFAPHVLRWRPSCRRFCVISDALE